MPTEKEMKEARKAIAYDLINIIDEKPEQETYTAEEIKKIITEVFMWICMKMKN